ncbi:Serine/threonine-protein phosphatase 7 long form [Glycine max]|nr:Serine/threonine-protein phosphatase 7 long form [Glycine max]
MAHEPLLCHQYVHRSCTTINDLITSYYHTIPKLESQIIPLFSSTGFQHIALIKQYRINPALITALVERWRPKTHTFHLPWGECNITLKDVALHLGIRVDGRVVAGPSFLHWDELYDKLLGEVPPKNARKGAALKLTWLLSILRTPLPEEPTTHQLQYRRRAYIMYMIGGALIPDKFGNKVYLIYLNLLHDLNNIKNSWGLTCLANLYRELCRASLEIGRVMGGLVPHAFYCTESPRPETTYPLAKRWSSSRLEYRVTTHGDLVRYRSRIDHMESHEDLKNTYRDMHTETWKFGLHVLQLFVFRLWNDIKQTRSSYNLDYNKISLLIP